MLLRGRLDLALAMKALDQIIRGGRMVLNGELRIPGKTDLVYPDPTFYEVIRYAGGRLLFLEDHLERLKASCKSAGFPAHHSGDMKVALDLLIQSENHPFGNVRLEVHPDGDALHTRCYFVPHVYPGPSDYEKGVLAVSLPAIRETPGVKRQNLKLRSQTDSLIGKEGIYEVLLMDETGVLTEGSRSNLFFLDMDQRIITAPSSLVLEGITRKYVLQSIEQLGYEVVFECLKRSQLSTMKGAFITGTSPKVLPLCQVDDVEFAVNHPKIRAIMESYDRLILQ